jgi:hypothetical protein
LRPRIRESWAGGCGLKGGWNGSGEKEKGEPAEFGGYEDKAKEDYN